MQNLSLDIIKNIFRANDIFITKGDMAAPRQRPEHQRKALSDDRLDFLIREAVRLELEMEKTLGL